MKQSLSQPEALERRSHSRAETHRPATVITDAQASACCQGRLLELGVGGFRLKLPVTIPVGTDIELEFVSPERPGSAPARVRGQIAWTLPESCGGSICGGPFKVKLRKEAASGQGLPSGLEARALLGMMGRQLQKVDAHDLLPVMLAPPAALSEDIGIPVQVQTCPGASRNAIRRTLQSAAAASVLAALLCLLLWLPAILGDSSRLPEAGAVARLDISSLEVQDSPKVQNLDGASASRPAGKPPSAHLLGPTELAPLPPSTNALSGASEILAAIPIGEGLPTLTDAVTGTPSDGIFPPVHTVLQEWVQSFPDLLRPAPQDAALVMARWEAYDQAMLETPSESFESSGEDDLEDLGEVFAGTTDPVILVDTQRYLMTVMDGDAMLAVFPVGLGAGGSTPEGSFAVANKIREPQWYNRGRPVAAGDRRNLLGEYWIGLGTEKGATSYGIHPTKEMDSIGAARSRGCIRMRPEDATRVFGWCKIGTPVIIGSFTANNGVPSMESTG